MSFLPDLPSGFGRDSAYPPMPPQNMLDSGQMTPPGGPFRVARGENSPSPRPAFMQQDGARSRGNSPSKLGRTHSPSVRDAAPAPPPAWDVPTPPSTMHAYPPPPPQRVIPTSPPPERRAPAAAPAASFASAPSASSRTQLQQIHVPFPDTTSLAEQRERAFASRSDVDILRWSTQVLKYVERLQASGTDMEEPASQWLDEAILQIVQFASHPEPKPEALYARGDLLASGAFPTYVAKDLRAAFNDFERSARMGFAPSWFRIGRDYETLNDIPRASAAYLRGAQRNDVSSLYRMGMANILGQLDMPVSMQEGVQFLRSAADLSTVDTPHPAYIYGLLLAGELNSVHVPIALLAESSAQARSVTRPMLAPRARSYLQRAAYLNLSSAQYKCGWCYEHAQLSFPFDPLLSVQYYSAASRGGEPDADMALSKWFLCGAEGCFDKNESLAWTFAERAAKYHLPTAQFALGYYLEVGIGTSIDLDAAKAWYIKAAAQGNDDAKSRLEALQRSQDALSRTQHQAYLQSRMYDEHLLARGRSANHGRAPQAGGNPELVRKQTMRMVDESVRDKDAQERRDDTARAQTPVRNARADAPKRGPTTFSEMGYQPKPERECTIM
ncbi:hypothetical protein MVES1_002257 [Malassezia vespertilionis]|uniref:Uncharacterized protein n=1 Tax=Malassezia vespertilionis TaxID=2020962 RepID=A0A2N1JC85_9BASI|nr:uncharacterized protein MVES1_002257 [Malassezia vespertilionis]PKI84147.1 hypothetical protein MVES_002129 [Malassezia vespertilionis]WFD06902.1 hypothetical protein MVES1_002257 [Malassezia vespertilionis]